MEIESRSIDRFIKELVDQFKYEDFQPPIDPRLLKKKINDVICKETAYWSPLAMDPNGTWCGVHLKSFKRWEDCMVAISVRKDFLHFNFLDELNGFESPNNSTISLKTIWFNHESLTIFLTKHLKACLTFANREKHEESLKWNND